MKIDLPNELECSVRSLVQGGRFASEDEAVTEIVREYFRHKGAEQAKTPGKPEANGGLGSIGSMRDDAELLDQAVSYAMQTRGSALGEKRDTGGIIRVDLGPDPLLGSMRDAADELDEIVADAYRRRRNIT